MSERIAGSTTMRLSDLYAASYFAWSLFARVAYAGVVLVCIVGEMVLHFWQPGRTESAGEQIAMTVVVIQILVWFGMIAVVYRRLSPEQRRLTYDIDRERIAVHDAAGAAVIRPWSQIKSWREHKAGFMLKLRPVGSYWLSKSGFGPAELDAFRAFARAQVPTS